MEADRDADTVLHHIGGVKNQIVRCCNIDSFSAIPKPTGQFIPNGFPATDKQRNIQQIAGCDSLFYCQWMTVRH